MMQNATEFIKLRTNIRQFRRTFTLDSNLAHIHWTPTNKKPEKAKSCHFYCFCEYNQINNLNLQL